MTQQLINIGTAANDGTGDPLRTALNKVNLNFTELYAGGAGGGTNFPAGSLATPSVTFGGDHGSGFYAPASGALAMAAGTFQGMQVDSARLHVTSLGAGALNFTPTGDGNVALGFFAMGGGPVSGGYNVGIGFEPLGSVGAGSFNVAIGGFALAASNQSSQIAIGWQALTAATTGVGNVAIGHAALAHVTTTSNNVAIGSQALTNAIDANLCVAIGTQALFSYVSGAQFSMNSVAIGFSALGNTLTGYECCAVGTSVLGVMTSGFWNNGFGIQAMQSLTTGFQNDAIGTSALAGMTTGSKNIGIGMSVAFTNSANDAISCTSCIFIGNGAGFSTSAQLDHATIIGADAKGAAVNNSVTLGRRTGTIDTLFCGPVVTTGYTVATLPAASATIRGARAYVTDAAAPTFLGALTGGGAVVCPVFCNGAAWVAGG